MQSIKTSTKLKCGQSSCGHFPLLCMNLVLWSYLISNLLGVSNRIVSTSFTSNALSLPFKIHRYGMETRADIPGHLCFQTVDSRQSHALLDAFGPGFGRSKLSTYMKINMYICKCIHIQSIYIIFEINDNNDNK